MFRPPLALVLVLAMVAEPAAAELPTYAVVVRDGRIEPATLAVPAGVRLRLALSNGGTGPCEFENLGLRIEKVLAPGAVSTLVLHPLRPGTYLFVDEFHPDGAPLTLIAK
jgi:hypothetical protein